MSNVAKQMSSDQKSLSRLAQKMGRKPGESRVAWKNRRDKMKEKYFSSHRDIPSGKNFTCWNHVRTPGEEQRYRENFDAVFPNAPGAGF